MAPRFVISEQKYVA